MKCWEGKLVGDWNEVDSEMRRRSRCKGNMRGERKNQKRKDRWKVERNKKVIIKKKRIIV